jgi:hypothetical protein
MHRCHHSKHCGQGEAGEYLHPVNIHYLIAVTQLLDKMNDDTSILNNFESIEILYFYNVNSVEGIQNGIKKDNNKVLGLYSHNGMGSEVTLQIVKHYT